MANQVRDGWNEVYYPSGNFYSVANVYRVHGMQFASLNGGCCQISDLLYRGYTFVPLIAMTPARVAALKVIVNGPPWEMSDELFFAALAELRKLLTELEANDANS